MSNTKEIIAVSIIAGPEVSIQPGKRATVPADFADALVAGGYATLASPTEAAAASPAPESAAVETPETATTSAAPAKSFATKKK